MFAKPTSELIDVSKMIFKKIILLRFNQKIKQFLSVELSELTALIDESWISRSPRFPNLFRTMGNGYCFKMLMLI